jgi:carbon-monoxide dehydrogenase medium subunit
MYEFDYQRAESVDEAVDLLAEIEEARPLAGGMSLVTAMKLRLARPARLVDLNFIDDLRFIEEEPGRLIVGAMTRHEEVAASPKVRRQLPALATLAGGIGDVQVRRRGTIGGSISNNDPAACYPAAILALGTVVRTDRRTIPADDFFTGLFETELAPTEIVTAVDIPLPDAAAYVKFHNMASRFAIVGVFVARFGRTVRVAVTGAGAYVFRATDIEARLSDAFSPAALEGTLVSSKHLVSDAHGSPEYRAHLIPELARRAVLQCREAK